LWGGGRVSEIGIVCKDSAYNKYKQSINNWGSSYAMYGESVAHEIAHQLGMHHDHSKVNGGTGSSGSSINDCNGKGLMSYGHHLRVWSSCSKANFEAYYSQEKNNWCMQGISIAIIIKQLNYRLFSDPIVNVKILANMHQSVLAGQHGLLK
jgi:hypothetical protein